MVSPSLILINRSKNQFSVTLPLPAVTGSPRVKHQRSVSLLMAAGERVDLCLRFGLSFEEAEQLLARMAPDSRLLVRQWPPRMDEVLADAKKHADQVTAQGMTDALRPADPPGALPAGVNPEDVGLPPETPKMFQPPTKPVMLPKLEDTLEPVTAETDAEVASAASFVTPDEPSMDWPLARLREYATAHGLDASGSKTVLLRRLNGAGE